MGERGRNSAPFHFLHFFAALVQTMSYLRLMQNTNPLADAIRAQVFSLTSITDFETCCHSERNVLVTLTDEAGDARVFQVKALSPYEYSVSETDCSGETFYITYTTRTEAAQSIAYASMV